MPLALTEVRGQKATFAGLALTAATITWTGGSWLQARLASAGWRRKLTSVGLIVLAIGCAATAAVLFPTTPVVFSPIAWGIAGLGMGIAYSTLSLVVLEHAGQGSEGTATAAIQLLNVLGSALGAGVGGALVAYTSRGDKGVGVGIFWQIMLMLAVLALALLPRSACRTGHKTSPRVGEAGNRHTSPRINPGAEETKPAEAGWNLSSPLQRASFLQPDALASGRVGSGGKIRGSGSGSFKQVSPAARSRYRSAARPCSINRPTAPPVSGVSGIVEIEQQLAVDQARKCEPAGPRAVES